MKIINTTEALPPNDSICIVWINSCLFIGDWVEEYGNIPCRSNSSKIFVHDPYIRASHIPMLVKIDHKVDTYSFKIKDLLRKPYTCCTNFWIDFLNTIEKQESLKEDEITFSVLKDCYKWAQVINDRESNKDDE